MPDSAPKRKRARKPSEPPGDGLMSAALSFLQPTEAQVVTTELGLEVTVNQTRRERGQFTAEEIETERPDVARVIRNLLGTGMFGKDAIAKLCGVAWETVDAIERKSGGQIRDFKVRMAAKFQPLISEASEQLLKRIREGKVTAFDLKQLVETWSLLAGEATVRVETKEDPAVAAYRALMAEMGSQAGNISALPAPTAPAVHAWPAAPVLEAETLAVDLKSPAENT